MSILKLKDSQGNWIGVPTIKGDNGNGISSAVLNNDYTLTLTFTDGTTYTTPSIRGEKGEQGEPATSMEIHICSASEYDSETRIPTITNPNDKTFYLVPTEDGTSPDLFTEWVYVNNAWEMFGSASVDLSGYLTDVTVGGTSVVNDGVAEIPIASTTNPGIGFFAPQNGFEIDNNGVVMIAPASSSVIKSGTNLKKSIVPALQHEATFYGLAKASGDRTQGQSNNLVGQYTDEAKASIQSMLGVPSSDDVVSDVQVNNISVITDGVANVPVASDSNFGVCLIDSTFGVNITNTGKLGIAVASSAKIKDGTEARNALVPKKQHESVFYGLAKSAGDTTQSQSSNAVGNYTDNAKDKIQTMLGVSPLIAPHESDPFESNHVIGELFIIDGKLYRAKTALTAGEYINEGTNVEVVNTSDVYVKNTDYATSNKAGIVKAGSGLQMQTGNYVDTLAIAKAREVDMKAGSDMYRPIVSQIQHTATFYGLAKAAGDTTQSQSSNEVGTYTEEAKTAIKTMLGVHDTIDSFVEEVTGTDVTITGQPSYRYNCGEVLSLSITPPESGTIDIRFTSGSTPTVLTLPQTVKMPEWWVEVEANTIYEMCITDGIYCGVMTWAM